MLTLAQLWLPILVSAVLVFIASSLIHMVFKWHNADYRKLANEDEVAAAIRKGNATPGQYTLPHCLGMKEMQDPAMQQKYKDGPVALIALRRPGVPNMGPMLGQWFALNLAVAGAAACVAAQSLGAGAPPMEVAKLVGTVTFLAYAAGSVSDGIWMGRPWGAVAKDLLDAAIFAVVGGAASGWLWPG